ncbi:hypothetical protein FG93_03724 [Bosea sp. LC85]|uniref:hypothetical protein n=1 Tax=Bosea sp. LC85 TaxID=1502851 RepID=UPI0004E29B64|nr:hypothetical protein [Bosea sp. LC85]KFC68461.1 hypothetical protein FG93_03724 [Bosea sp. LC85]
MSTSKGLGTDFDAWLAKAFRKGPFTALIVLIRIAEPKVEPLRSTYVHVIGDEIDWGDIILMFRSAGVNWDAVAFFPTRGEKGGLLDDALARTRLRSLEDGLERDRLVLNHGELFDAWGRRMRVNET